MPEKKKETRIMRVTLDKEEFEKYDKGETHSDSGLRNESGRLSALPDIAPIEDADLPERKVIQTKILYQDRYITPPEPTFGEKLAIGAGNFVTDVLNDPEVQKSLSMLARAFWHYKVVPGIKRTVMKLKGENKAQIKTQINSDEKALASAPPKDTIEGEKEFSHDTFIVSEQQAEMIVGEARKKARELSALIYLLSNLCIKDEKNDEERYLEQTYIKQLVSEEATSTMKVLLANRQLNVIDEETAISFEDFLKGYIRNGKELVPIPQKYLSD